MLTILTTTIAAAPLLILCAVIVATIALFRAKQDDVPRVFEAFASAFGIRAHGVRETGYATTDQPDGGTGSAAGTCNPEETQ